MNIKARAILFGLLMFATALYGCGSSIEVSSPLAELGNSTAANSDEGSAIGGGNVSEEDQGGIKETVNPVSTKTARFRNVDLYKQDDNGYFVTGKGTIENATTDEGLEVFARNKNMWNEDIDHKGRIFRCPDFPTLFCFEVKDIPLLKNTLNKILFSLYQVVDGERKLVHQVEAEAYGYLDIDLE